MPAMPVIVFAALVVIGMQEVADPAPRIVAAKAVPLSIPSTDTDRVKAVQSLLDSGLRIGNPFPRKNSSQPMPTEAGAARARYIAQLARIASVKGLDRSPDVLRAMTSLEAVILAEKLIQAMSDSIPINEREVRTRFDAEPNLYDELEISHILFAPDARDKTAGQAEAAAMSRAKEVQARLAAGEDFAKLATEYSDDAQSAQEGGVLPTILGASLQPVFHDAVAKLKVGEYSAIVKGEHGFHIVRLDRRTHAYAGPARTLIEEEIRQRELRRMLEQLKISRDGTE